MPDCQWPNDDLIDQLVDRMAAEFRELIIREYFMGEPPEDPGFEVFFNHARTKLAVEAYALITLSPPEIWESYHSLRAAGGETFSGDLDTTVNAIEDSVSDWEGVAAEAFSKHVEGIKSFVQFQAKYMDRTLQHLAAAYKLGVSVREDYKAFAEGWIRVSQEYRKSKDDQELSVSLKVGAALVASVVAAVTAPEVVIAGLAAGASAIGAFVEGYTGTLGGGSAAGICDSYVRLYGRLKESYEQELEQLRLFVMDQTNEISQQQPQLYEPLPTSCDIDSPDFRYENFFHDFTPPGNYERKVAAERKKYVAEKSGPHELSQGPISRALSGTEVENA